MSNMKTKRKPIIKIGRTPNQISFALGYKKCKEELENKAVKWMENNIRVVHVGNKHYVVVNDEFTNEYDFIVAFKQNFNR